MRRKSTLLGGVAACGALILTSCGGDEPAPSPTPTPTTSPSPTPTPTPTPTSVDFDFTKDFEASVTNASYIYAYFAPDGGAEVWSGGSPQGGQSVIDYDVSPNTVSFAGPDTSAVRSFAAADLQVDTATRRSYRKGTEGLVLELPFEHILRVSYERVDPYVRETVPGNLRSTRVSIFFNGITTTSDITSDLAYTGTAEVVGGKSGVTAPGVFSSPATTLTVTASDKKITGSIRIVRMTGGTTTVVAVLPITAVISAGGVFSGDINDTANGFKGKFAGTLAGPSREEAFVIFNVLHTTDGRTLLGSLIAD